jgi:2-oxoglutarate dehydrogenase complex dehydrogenase (E1) component-like enzyme
MEEFTQGSFRLVLDDPAAPDRDLVRRLVLCSGKIFFPLQAARNEHGVDDLALVRVEQLYPFPTQAIQAIAARYRRVEEVCWVQEEPANMGAWAFMQPRLLRILPDTCVLSYHGRDEAASPATGSFHEHEIEEAKLVRDALDLDHHHAISRKQHSASEVTNAAEKQGQRRPADGSA